jgi:23S rRNA (cytosine1962-C5)-methyltransferase
MKESISQTFARAFKKREALLKSTNAVRLVNGIGDGLNGLVIEQYNRHFVVQIFEKMWLEELTHIKRFFKEEYVADFLIIKDRSSSPSSNPDAFRTEVLIEQAPSTTIVEEYGVKFSVDLNDGLNSGLFLDMRQNRQVVRALSKDKKVLNCFAYTCSFGVHCKAAGAVSVSNVDISQKCLQRGRNNYELNQLPVGEYEFVRADAGYYLDRAVLKGNRFDMIILDPPSFSRHDKQVFSVKKDLEGLIHLSLKALNPGGHLFVATNFSGITALHLQAMLPANQKFNTVEQYTQDKDFIGTGRSAESYLAAMLVAA